MCVNVVIENVMLYLWEGTLNARNNNHKRRRRVRCCDQAPAHSIPWPQRFITITQHVYHKPLRHAHRQAQTPHHNISWHVCFSLSLFYQRLHITQSLVYASLHPFRARVSRRVERWDVKDELFLERYDTIVGTVSIFCDFEIGWLMRWQC